MTKKHFEKLAREFSRLLALANNPEIRSGIVVSILMVADVCSEANPRFDYARFTKACGL